MHEKEQPFYVFDGLDGVRMSWQLKIYNFLSFSQSITCLPSFASHSPLPLQSLAFNLPDLVFTMRGKRDHERERDWVIRLQMKTTYTSIALPHTINLTIVSQYSEIMRPCSNTDRRNKIRIFINISHMYSRAIGLLCYKQEN